MIIQLTRLVRRGDDHHIEHEPIFVNSRALTVIKEAAFYYGAGPGQPYKTMPCREVSLIGCGSFEVAESMAQIAEFFELEIVIRTPENGGVR